MLLIQKVVRRMKGSKRKIVNGQIFEKAANLWPYADLCNPNSVVSGIRGPASIPHPVDPGACIPPSKPKIYTVYAA